jgi:hypothetical protein
MRVPNGLLRIIVFLASAAVWEDIELSFVIVRPFFQATPDQHLELCPFLTEARSPSKPNGFPLRAAPHYGLDCIASSPR